jgi:hypothetical protein
MNIFNKAKIKAKENVFISIKDKNGNPKKLWQPNILGNILKVKIPYITGFFTYEYKCSNLIVNAGLAGIASRYNGDGSEAAFTYIAVGTDDTAATAVDTTLGAEIADSGLERAVADTIERTTTTVANDTARLIKAFSVTGTKAINEVGIFNASSDGTMGSRTVITTKNVENGDTITITYTLAVAEA